MAQADDHIDQVRSHLGSIAEIMERHGMDSSPKRRLCPNPSHGDRKPGSVNIFTGRDGKERLFCHACGFRGDNIDVARVLGEHVDLKHPDFRQRPFQVKPKVDISKNQLKTRLANYLNDDPTVVFDWMAAKKLAALPRIVARQEIARNWDYLSTKGNIPRINELADSLREYAIETYGLNHSGEHGAGYEVALTRAIKDSEA